MVLVEVFVAEWSSPVVIILVGVVALLPMVVAVVVEVMLIVVAIAVEGLVVLVVWVVVRFSLHYVKSIISFMAITGLIYTF